METLAAIIRGEPDWQVTSGYTPQNVRFKTVGARKKIRAAACTIIADLRMLMEERNFSGNAVLVS